MDSANETRRQLTSAELLQLNRKELIQRLKPEVERLNRETWPWSKFSPVVDEDTLRFWRKKSCEWLGSFLNYCLAREKWPQPCDQNQGGQT